MMIILLVLWCVVLGFIGWRVCESDRVIETTATDEAWNNGLRLLLTPPVEPPAEPRLRTIVPSARDSKRDSKRNGKHVPQDGAR